MKAYVLLIGIILISCGRSAETTAIIQEGEAQAYVLDLSRSDEKFNNHELLNDRLKFTESILDRFDTVKLNGQVYYVAEGDLFLTADDVIRHLKIQEKLEMQYIDVPKLMIARDNGRDIKQENPMQIRYAIVESSFENISEYQEIMELMNVATNDWEATCQVDFVYKAEMDEQLSAYITPNNLTFIVQKLEMNKDWYAKAPFPDHKKSQQQLIITNRFFSSSYTKEGLLRHELGHVLGFLHEHLRVDSEDKCPEGIFRRARYLTSYDPKSVMHYFCEEGWGTKELEITALDKIGAQCIYPDPNFDVNKNCIQVL